MYVKNVQINTGYYRIIHIFIYIIVNYNHIKHIDIKIKYAF